MPPSPRLVPVHSLGDAFQWAEDSLASVLHCDPSLSISELGAHVRTSINELSLSTCCSGIGGAEVAM
eukprot:5065790-Pyramimonas_sp.AAC.1